MKKFFSMLAIVLTALIVLTMPVTAFANSAQRQFYGVSSNGAIVTDKDCPVTVTAERLTFNINSYPSPYDGSMTDYNANVTAEYDFYNPADYDVNMQLVFPFGQVPAYGHYDDFNDTDKYSVYVDGEKIEREIRAIYSDYNSQFDLSRDLPKISDEPIPYRDLPDDTLVYKYVGKNTFEQYNLEHTDTYVADFDYSGKNLFLSTQEGYRVDDSQGYKLRVYSSNEFCLYSVGEALDDSFFSATYYAILYDNQGRTTAKMVSGSTSFELKVLSLEEFLLTYYDEESNVTRLDYRNAVATCLNKRKTLTSNVMPLSLLDMSEMLMLWYQYDVSIPAGQTVTNKVVAPLYPDINAYYSPTKFSYKYLLSPASCWADFSNLDVTINTDYYMSNASLEGFEQIDGGYKAHFDKLPQGELTFDLCAAEKPEYDNDSDDSTMWWVFTLLLLFLPLLIIFGLVYGITALAIIIISFYVLWVLAAAITIPIVMTRDKRRMQQRKQSGTTSQEQKLINDSLDILSNEENGDGNIE